MDLDRFLGPVLPLPEQPAALFVGVLEHYKDVDGLAAAWRLAAPQVPGARLRIVGRGTRRRVVEELLRDLPDQTVWDEQLATTGAELIARRRKAAAILQTELGRVFPALSGQRDKVEIRYRTALGEATDAPDLQAVFSAHNK